MIGNCLSQIVEFYVAYSSSFGCEILLADLSGILSYVFIDIYVPRPNSI